MTKLVTLEGLQKYNEMLQNQIGGGNSSSEKDWSQILDVTITDKTVTEYKADNLDNLTEIVVQCGKLKNESTTASGMLIKVNGVQVTNNDLTIQNQDANTSTNGSFRWIYLRLVADERWQALIGPVYSLENTKGYSNAWLKHFPAQAGRATKVSVCQPIPQFAAREGFVKVWGR